MLAGVLLPQMVLIGAACLLLWFGIRGGLAPLGSWPNACRRRIRAAATPRGDGVPLEVQPLALALNDLLARLESAQTAQRRFVADSAHQLRTPLTSLKLNMEQVLLDVEAGVASEAVAPMLRECARAVERVTRLSNQLLLLARAEPVDRLKHQHQAFPLFALKASCQRNNGAAAISISPQLEVLPRMAKTTMVARICAGLPSCWPSSRR